MIKVVVVEFVKPYKFFSKGNRSAFDKKTSDKLIKDKIAVLFHGEDSIDQDQLNIDTYGKDFFKQYRFSLHTCPKCNKDYGFFTARCENKKCNISFKNEIEKEFIKFKKYEEENKESSEYIEIKELRNQIFELIADKKINTVTEEIVKFITDKKYIYTIRSDDKPEIWIYCDKGENKGIYYPDGKTYIKEITRNILQYFYKPNLLTTIISKIEADTFINQDEFFTVKDRYEIPVNNGLLNIRTRKLTDFTPKRIYFNKLPMDYIEDADCINIKKHFNAILKDNSDIEVMQELFGWTLVKDYIPEKAVMFLGDGRNGKGKTIELMKFFLNPKNCVNIGLKSIEGDDSFNICELHNKLANLGSDISNQTIKETNVFKELTGHDMVSASRKFKTKISFQNYAKMIFSANELPKTLDKTLAFFNRWIIIDFPYTFLPKSEYDENNPLNKLRDNKIIDKLTDTGELCGLLNFALDGLDRLEKTGNFSNCLSTDQIKNKWIRKSDSFSAFLQDCIIGDFDSFISKSDLKNAYFDYVQKNNLKFVNDTYIKTIITTDWGCCEVRKTIDKDSLDRCRCWVGIKFKEQYESKNVHTDHSVHGFSPYTNIEKQAHKGKKVVKVDMVDI